jgi:salicylate hydroxylase
LPSAPSGRHEGGETFCPTSGQDPKNAAIHHNRWHQTLAKQGAKQAARNKQKFFASFFQKRRPSFFRSKPVTRSAKIIIAGGGIGGLTAALALLRAGFEVEVHEQAAALGEVGAGLTLGKGALQCCAALGIGAEVWRHAAPVGDYAFLHYRTGEVLARDEPGPNGQQNAVIYRTDFHTILANAVCAHGPGRIHLGHRLTGLEQDDYGATARFANGNTARGDLLIGADGVRSAVRRLIFGDGEPEFTNRIAFRFMLPSDQAEQFLSPGGAACLFVGHGRVFNRYLVSNKRWLNCVALQRSREWMHDGWNHQATPGEMLAGFAEFHPSVISLMQRAPPDRLIKWGIFARPPRKDWVQGRVALLGDAAHPMQPFLGLGAAMAVEDASVLGRACAEKPTLQEALAAYAQARIPRANQIMRLSQQQGDLFDSTDPADYPPRGAPAHDASVAAYDPMAVVL